MCSTDGNEPHSEAFRFNIASETIDPGTMLLNQK